MAVFGIVRKLNVGPTCEMDSEFDPSNPNHSTGTGEAYFADGSWKIDIESIEEIENIVDKYGIPVSVIFRRNARPTIVLMDTPRLVPSL